MSEYVKPGDVNINEPRWDQSLYWNRAKHFFVVTNPFNLLSSGEQLNEAKNIVTKYRSGESLPISENELWRYKYLYDSAHHPETGEKQIIFGRMAAQVPMNMLITGCMLTFYKTTPQVMFWQWFNQSFNAVVNYTNRSGDCPIPVKQLGLSYVMATSGALVTALSLNSLVKKAPAIVGRFVPFCAVAAANCVNIPMMRQKELNEGIAVTDENGNKLGNSKIAARTAIIQVVMSRIGMCAPGMIIPPFIMDYLERKGTLKRYPFISAPLQVVICGFFLIFTTPLCCALFPQKSQVHISSLEPEIQKLAKELKSSQYAYYNKGL
ncbi:sideroflexin 1:2:3-like protein [Leptotrombidium deliense]|uniref:Sidoreflexin n=1 Tax=Leptotrombidium deliense TaxID=299467 RepID=A0A443SJG4_9ACAR|nr:sideroflexin 1:2:3-like protein [Leptotrombidium deliense]